MVQTFDCDIFLLSKWDDNTKQFEIMILSMLILWIFVIILITTEFGERVTFQFERFGVEFEQCKWNNLPIEMQRIYLIFLLDTQQPQNIQSFGGIPCTRKTLEQVFIRIFIVIPSILICDLCF